MMFMRFKNREDAAQRLLPHLSIYRNEQSVVLAVPRGGVPIAYPIAKSYNLPLELLMTKKIGHPAHQEFAIGAVSLEGYIIENQHGVPQTYIDNEVKRIKESLKERYNYFMSNHKPISLKDKTVIIVDDGIATGNTILSAIKMLRQAGTKKIVVAVPVSTYQAAEKIKQQVDDFICLYMPEPFIGVGLHYIDFSQVSDEEVVQLLKDANHFEDAA
jgi:predicted phosphoribosyltransferase